MVSVSAVMMPMRSIRVISMLMMMTTTMTMIRMSTNVMMVMASVMMVSMVMMVMVMLCLLEALGLPSVAPGPARQGGSSANELCRGLRRGFPGLEGKAEARCRACCCCATITQANRSRVPG